MVTTCTLGNHSIVGTERTIERERKREREEGGRRLIRREREEKVD